MKLLLQLMNSFLNFVHVSNHDNTKSNDIDNEQTMSKSLKQNSVRSLVMRFCNNHETHEDMTFLKFLAINAFDLSVPASDILWKTQRETNCWFQLSGHPDSLAPAGPGTIWKRILNESEKCTYESLMTEPNFKDFIPLYYRCVEFNNDKFIELQDLLSGFENPVLMDIKMGTRTFLESEVQNKTLRADLYKKMYAIDPNAFTDQENCDQAITKLRYMQFREEQSSSNTMGFRIEAIRLLNCAPEKLSTVRSRNSINETLLKYIQNEARVRDQIVHQLRHIRDKLEQSKFFEMHEFIGSSLFLSYDQFKVGVWLIDFAKTVPLPSHIERLTHRQKWAPGNFEDGFLFGLDNLITDKFDCRICKSSSRQFNFIKPCKCNGTMAFVHLQCLIRWLQECGRNECELCRHKFNIKREKKFGPISSLIQWGCFMFINHSVIPDICFVSFLTPAVFFINSVLLIISEQNLNDVLEDGYNIPSYGLLFLSVMSILIEFHCFCAQEYLYLCKKIQIY